MRCPPLMYKADWDDVDDDDRDDNYDDFGDEEENAFE